jgi:predicted dehydrogenase
MADVFCQRGLASRNISAIAICTPPGSHCELAVRAIEAGKAVIVEKPPVLTEGELDAIIEASRRAHIPALVMLQHRARLPIFQTAIAWGPNAGGHLEVIRKRPREHYLSNPWRSDVQQASGGHLAHLGIHFIDLACQVLGNPVQIEGVVNCRDADGIDTNSALSVRFESGALFTMVSNAESDFFSERMFVFDDQKQLIIDHERTDFIHGERSSTPKEKTALLRARVYEELMSALFFGKTLDTFSIERARGAVRIAEAVRAIAMRKR